MSKFNGVKTNNAKTTAKRDIRLKILNSIAGDKSVLEVYCGAGEMYFDVWKNAKKYTGIDINKYFDERNTICGDALKAVSTIDLDEFTIFDIDAYGSPYEVIDVITNRITGMHKEYGFIVTDGISMDLRLGRICKGVRALTGVDFHIAKRAGVIHHNLIADIIKTIESRLNGKHSDFVIAEGKTGAAMKYYAFKIKVNDAAES